MDSQKVVQGRVITPADVEYIRGLMVAQPTWNRTRISQHLCERWDWRNGKGRMKDMAARTLLLKLERLGELTLPARQKPSQNHNRNRSLRMIPHETAPIACNLKDLGAVEITVVTEPEGHALVSCLLRLYHYLGFKNTVGETLKYLVRDGGGRLLGCLVFGSAAWKTAPRDEFIGWDRLTRERNLPFLTNNMRYLILPWVRVPHLASHVLGRVSRRLSSDWEEKYGHPIHLLETFVHVDRYRGTCYRAANWIYLGETTGRTRNDRKNTMQVPRKAIFVYPLSRGFRKALCRGGADG